MAINPPTLKRCYAHIKAIEADRDRYKAELELISDTYHTLARDYERLLNSKDREMLEKCQKCVRGIR